MPCPHMLLLPLSALVEGVMEVCSIFEMSKILLVISLKTDKINNLEEEEDVIK